ncbi:MAG: DinB family protein [Pirellulales bacterium]|nr:DinB family protein [Pirellulales bacterium]
MELKPRLKSQLLSARDYSERLLTAFKTPQEWVHQVHAHANHPLWFAGHMGVSDDFFISLVAPERAKRRPELVERFGTGSQPVGDASAYPPVAEVLAYMRERRQTLMEILDSLSEEDLLTRTPPGTPDFLRDKASVFQTASWHEGLHSGQVSVAHRALGHKPVVGRTD